MCFPSVVLMKTFETKISFVITQEKDVANARHCPACGAVVMREQARFCAICGRALEGAYFPTDALRSSYHQQEDHEKNLRSETDTNQVEAQEKSEVLGNLFEAEKNPLAKMALAFATYALVPYLGILFCPCAIICGGFALVGSYRVPIRGGRRASYTSIVLGFLILCAQLVLWWLLYKIPELSRNF